MKSVYWLVGLLLLVLGIGGVFVLSGAYNVAADEPHWKVTQYLMEKARTHSIAARASAIEVPALDDEALVTAGAGNYDAMCADCHGKPGVDSTELSRGLYPAPPQFASHPVADPAAAFWVIEHGIKMSGMPAWGKSMKDEYIWGMVAFLKRLPGLSADEYRELVEASGGHHHGGSDSDTQEEESEGEHARPEAPAAEAQPHEHAAHSHDHDDSDAPPHQH